MNTPPARTEELKLRGDTLVSRLKELVHEGNIRRITIKNEEGHTLIDIPLTVGVVGALLLPVWAAVGAIAALAANLTILVERTDTDHVLQDRAPDQPETGAPHPS
jgi:DNA-binding Lrp family transcriptional regulator